MTPDTNELVDCNVQVTMALARRLRKATLAEREGLDARSALMVAAGCDPAELDSLRAQVQTLSDDLEEREQRLATLKVASDKRGTDLSQVRKQLGEREQTVSSLRKELQTSTERITALDQSLAQYQETQRRLKNVAEKIRTVVSADGITDDQRSPVLAGATGYDCAVDEALSLIGSLREDNADLNNRVTPLSAVLESGGVKAWIVRRALGLS
jgi:DNA repair exonuclease SbcCD ATPase subunit